MTTTATTRKRWLKRLGLVAFIVFVEFYTCGVVFSMILPGRWSGTWFGMTSSFSVAGSFVVLFLAAAAARIERSVGAVLDAGVRTADIAAAGRPPVSTAAMGDAVVAALSGDATHRP